MPKKTKFFLDDFCQANLAAGSIFLGTSAIRDLLYQRKTPKSLSVLLDAVGLTVFRLKKRKRRQAYVQLGGISGLDEVFKIRGAARTALYEDSSAFVLGLTRIVERQLVKALSLLGIDAPHGI
jgi:hypothetical protein